MHSQRGHIDKLKNTILFLEGHLNIQQWSHECVMRSSQSESIRKLRVDKVETRIRTSDSEIASDYNYRQYSRSIITDKALKPKSWFVTWNTETYIETSRIFHQISEWPNYFKNFSSKPIIVNWSGSEPFFVYWLRFFESSFIKSHPIVLLNDPYIYYFRFSSSQRTILNQSSSETFRIHWSFMNHHFT